MHLHGYADYYTRGSPPCDHKMHLHRFADFSSRRFTEIAAKCFYDLGITWMNKPRSLSAQELKTWLAEMGIAHSGSKDTLTNRRAALILSFFLSLSLSLSLSISVEMVVVPKYPNGQIEINSLVNL